MRKCTERFRETTFHHVINKVLSSPFVALRDPCFGRVSRNGFCVVKKGASTCYGSTELHSLHFSHPTRHLLYAIHSQTEKNRREKGGKSISRNLFFHGFCVGQDVHCLEFPIDRAIHEHKFFFFLFSKHETKENPKKNKRRQQQDDEA